MDGTLAILFLSQPAKKGNRRLLISFADVGLLQLELHGKPLPCTDTSIPIPGETHHSKFGRRRCSPKWACVSGCVYILTGVDTVLGWCA